MLCMFRCKHTRNRLSFLNVSQRHLGKMSMILRYHAGETNKNNKRSNTLPAQSQIP